jgi:hypothetical protein
MDALWEAPVQREAPIVSLPVLAELKKRRDEFLSDEDLDLASLTTEELDTYWLLWLTQAQATNDADRASCSHGVFDRDPSVS